MAAIFNRAARQFASGVRSLMGAALLNVLIAVDPVVASRPRVSKWGTYYAKTYKVWMKEADGSIKYDGPVIDKPCFLLVEQVCRKARTSVRLWPRGDWDNYAKGPADALVKTGVLKDDDLVIGGACVKRYADPGEEPCSIITIGIIQED